MDDIQVWGFSIDVVNAVISIAVIVFPIVSGLIVTALLGAQMLPAFRKAFRSIREYVDQPTDSFIVKLAEELKVDPEWLSKKFTEFVDAMGKEPVPAPEVAIYKSALTLADLADRTLPTPAPETLPENAKIEAVL